MAEGMISSGFILYLFLLLFSYRFPEFVVMRKCLARLVFRCQFGVSFGICEKVAPENRVITCVFI